jgi:hypothetical protein
MIAQTMTTDPTCWLDCLSLGANQSDPDTCVVRPMEGISALTELAPGILALRAKFWP